MPLAARISSLLSRPAAIMASRLAGAGVGFLTQFLLVKLMGAHHLGIFYSASSAASVLGVLAAQGYPQVAARFVGRYRNKQDDTLFAKFARHAMRDGILFAVAGALGVMCWAFLSSGLSPEEQVAYSVGGWMVLAIVTLNILTNIAGGMRLFNLCYMPEGMLRPFIFFALVGMAGLAGITLTAQRTMVLFAAVTALLSIGVALQLRRSMPRLEKIRIARTTLSRRWRREAWQLVLLAIFTNFFADVGILAATPFLDSSNVAIFGLCLKLALLVGYFVQIGQQMVVPDMVDARHAGDNNRIRRAAWRSIVLPSAITLASILVTFFFGEELLSLFGPEFSNGRRALLILLAAQMLRALAGPSAHLLTLTGIQSVNMGIAVSSLAVLFGGSAVLSPALGVEGTAYAVLVTYIFWIGSSAVSLRFLREPSVDVIWLTFSGWRRAGMKGLGQEIAGVARSHSPKPV
jgi:O-antigen/teichoic acid export membrane protein